MLRFSLATLLLVVLFAAVGCAALVNATELWRQATVTLTVLTLTGATLAAIHLQRDSRVFIGGFALTGWVYLLLSFVSVFGLRDDLLSSQALAWLYATVHPDSRFFISSLPHGQVVFTRNEDGTASGLDPTTGLSIVGRPLTLAKVNSKDFTDIGHSLWAIMLACVGGCFAQFLAKVQERRDRRSAGETEPNR